MYDTLQKFAEIRKQERANIVRDLNLYPITQNLLTLERKYGDSLNFEDLNGYRKKKRKRQQSRQSAGSSVPGSVSDEKTDASPMKSAYAKTQTATIFQGSEKMS